MPCVRFEPTVKDFTNKKNLGFRTIQMEDMPEDIRPPYFPYFYLREGNKILDEWGGIDERKLESVVKRNLE